MCFGKALAFLEQRMDAFEEFHFVVPYEILLIDGDKGVAVIEEFAKRPSVPQQARPHGMHVEIM